MGTCHRVGGHGWRWGTAVVAWARPDGGRALGGRLVHGGQGRHDVLWTCLGQLTAWSIPRHILPRLRPAPASSARPAGCQLLPGPNPAGTDVSCRHRGVPNLEHHRRTVRHTGCPVPGPSSPVVLRLWDVQGHNFVLPQAINPKLSNVSAQGGPNVLRAAAARARTAQKLTPVGRWVGSSRAWPKPAEQAQQQHSPD